jgi:excisionase family DNA binding protein
VTSSDAGGRATSRLVGRDGTTIELPEGIHTLLVSIVENLRAGNGVSVIPLHAELTTVQAAELLNVSRPYLTKRIDAGELPHHMVGTHRRLKLLDVLDAMTAEAEDLGLYGVPTSGQPRFRARRWRLRTAPLLAEVAGRDQHLVGSVDGRSEHPRVSTISRGAEAGCSPSAPLRAWSPSRLTYWFGRVRSRGSSGRAIHAGDRD